MIRIWEDTPKRGETYGGWFYCVSHDGHIIKCEGGLLSYQDAAKRAENYYSILRR